MTRIERSRSAHEIGHLQSVPAKSD